MTAPATNPFWRFSLRVYRAAGVQQACLALQEQCQADVNLLLFCGWVGSKGRVLDGTELRSALVRVGVWQSEVIAPLRAARRALKQQVIDAPSATVALPLRNRLATLELDLERIEQDTLAEIAAQWPKAAQRLPRRHAIADNLDSYFAMLGRAIGPQEAAHLACITHACSPRP